MKTNDAGVELIKTFEGLELEAYEDIAGILTIGYGHTSAAGAPTVEHGMRIDEAEAEAILRKDLKKFENGVASAVTIDVNENEFSALVSFAFNVGIGALRSSTALKRLNSGDREGAADALMWWNKATVDGKKVEVRGLTRRRAAERALFLTPVEVEASPRDATIEESTRLVPEEGGPRRENLSESRTLQGAGVAGAAGLGAAGLGISQEAAESGGAETPTEPPAPADPAPADPAPVDPAPTEPAPEEPSAPVIEPDMPAPQPDDGMIEVDPSATPPDVDTQAVLDDIHMQLYVALGAIVALAVLFIFFARIDDWVRGRR